MIATAGDLIAFALRVSGINGVGQVPSAEDANDALDTLRFMVAGWQRKRWLVWDDTDVAFVATGAQFYTVGTGGDIPVARPDRIESAFVRISTAPTSLPTSPAGLGAGVYWNDGGVVAIIPGGTILPTSPVGLANGAFWNDGGVLAIVGTGPVGVLPVGVVPLPFVGGGLDLPLAIIDSREDYNRIGLKSLSTFPAGVFYDSAFPLGKVYVWPIPAAGQYEIHLSFKVPLQAFASLAEAITMPPEYIEALVYSLAVRLSMAYGADPKPSIVGAMRQALNVIRMANTQVAQLGMPAGLAGGRGSGVAASASPSFQSGSW